MEAYRDSAEHLTDELKRVDLLIRRALTIARDRRAHGGEEYRGLVISEPEIDELLESGEFLMQHWRKQDRNQAKLDPLNRKLLTIRKTIDRRRNLTAKAGRVLTLPRLAERFGLSAAEVDLLLIAMAPELEPRYETLYAYLQDDVTRKRPSVDLALNLICRSEREKLLARRFLSPGAPLVQSRMLELLEEPHDRLGLLYSASSSRSKTRHCVFFWSTLPRPCTSVLSCIRRRVSRTSNWIRRLARNCAIWWNPCNSRGWRKPWFALSAPSRWSCGPWRRPWHYEQHRSLDQR